MFRGYKKKFGSGPEVSEIKNKEGDRLNKFLKDEENFIRDSIRLKDDLEELLAQNTATSAEKKKLLAHIDRLQRIIASSVEMMDDFKKRVRGDLNLKG